MHTHHHHQNAQVAAPHEVHDLVVVGAGIAGLAAALTAASAGHHPLVLDAHPVGGRARTVDRDGYALNVGPHAIYRGAAFEQLLGRFGITFGAGVPDVARTKLIRDGVVHDQPLTPLALARTPLLRARERAQLAATFGRIRFADPRRLAGVTVADWLADLATPVRQFVEMLVRVSTYTDAPTTFDAGAAVAQLQLATGKGVRYVDGGWGRLVEAMCARLATLGGTVRTGAEVAAVGAGAGSEHASTDESLVVLADGTQLRATAVVIAAGGPDLVARLTGRTVADIPGAAGLTPPVTASVLDLGLGRAHPVTSYGLDEPLYLSAHAPAARLAPDGAGLVTVMRYQAPGAPEVDRDASAAELRRHAWRSGLDPADVVVDRFLHRLVVSHGAPSAAGGGLAGRPTVDALALPGVRIAGDWVGPEGMLADAAVASGVAAARSALATTRARIHA